MGEHLAWITYNHGFSEVADEDPRDTVFMVQIKLVDPTPEGLTTKQEFANLQILDEAFEAKITELNGVYAGRLTVAGTRVLYYYLQAGQPGLEKGLESLNELTDYTLGYSFEADPNKERYWKELFPTPDDWQVIQDMQTLEALADNEDNPGIERDVFHWAYFEGALEANQFAAWAKSQKYIAEDPIKEEEGERLLVKFVSFGSMQLGDITSHTIGANRKARELGGEYDGWETSVEKS